MEKKEIAAATFDSDFNCAQAVLSTFCEELDLDRDVAAIKSLRVLGRRKNFYVYPSLSPHPIIFMTINVGAFY